MSLKQWACCIGTVLMWAMDPAIATPSTAALLRPADAEDVQLSPSGKRLAFFNHGKKSERDFAVLERHGNGFAPIFVTQLPASQSFTGYQWLSDGFIALTFNRSDETLDQLAIANIAKRSITVLAPAERLIKAHWGDDEHALISTSIGCSVAESVSPGRCLVAQNLNDSGRNTVAPYVRLLPLTFTVISPTEIYVRGYDVQRQEHAMQFDVASRSWNEIEAAALTKVMDAQRDKQMPRTPGMPAGSRLIAPSDQAPIGYVSPAPSRGFTSLSDKFDALEVALETRFDGRHAALSQVSDDLNVGLVRVSALDVPTDYLLWDRAVGLLKLDMFGSTLSDQVLGSTHIEGGWLPNATVRVTAPPKDIPIIGVMVHPVLTSDQLNQAQPSAYFGLGQVFAVNGIVDVFFALPTPEKFADGQAASAWRQRMHQSIQQVINTASKQYLQGAPVCLMGREYAGSMLLSGAAYDNVACTVAIDAPLLPANLSQRIQLGTTAYMKLGNGTLEREVRGAFAQPDGSLLEPAEQVANLPTKVMLAYNLTEPLYEVFARSSSGFRSAAKKAGKAITYEAPLDQRDDAFAYFVRETDAVVHFVVAASTTKSIAATP